MRDDDEQITTAQRSQISREYLLLRQRIIITITLSARTMRRAKGFSSNRAAGAAQKRANTRSLTRNSQHTEISPSEKTD
jgi:hypothetical protein